MTCDRFYYFITLLFSCFIITAIIITIIGRSVVVWSVVRGTVLIIARAPRPQLTPHSSLACRLPACLSSLLFDESVGRSSSRQAEGRQDRNLAKDVCGNGNKTWLCTFEKIIKSLGDWWGMGTKMTSRVKPQKWP